MYIAINMSVAHYDLQRALRFALRAETLIDIILEVNKREDWKDFNIYYVR